MKSENVLQTRLPEILMITSYPPRECGIATYSQDLIKALDNKFSNSFGLRICAIESEFESHVYNEPGSVLNVDQPEAFARLATKINNSPEISLVLIQHEFGFFEKKKDQFIGLMENLRKPVVICFHTVLPDPNELLKQEVQAISGSAEAIIVMTNASAKILNRDYGIHLKKITVIPHGTHLVPHLDNHSLKTKYHLEGKKILSTFGLLGSGKSIETTLDALPAVIKKDPDVLFLIIGKTHPSVIKKEGEQYREKLKAKVVELNLGAHVKFINQFLPLQELLEYLQLTDIYLFSSKDRNQAVSGTFSYAVSSGCPIISTPIPHALETLNGNAGIIFDFEDSTQLSTAINSLLENEDLRKSISSNGLHRMASTAWENAAIAHAVLFEKIWENGIQLRYNVPVLNLDHFRKMTTHLGMIQFSKINHPDIASGYTLDDNARALIAMCRHFELTGDESDTRYIATYFDFIKHCQQPGGNFLNYVDEQNKFTEQNYETNLEDSNGRAIWALGYLISLKHLFHARLISEAEAIMQAALQHLQSIHSTRAMSFAIKGLYYRNSVSYSEKDMQLIRQLADRLVEMYMHEKNNEWCWFESYLTYANSVIPEAMLCAGLITGDSGYKEIAKASFDFLLGKIFIGNRIKVIPNHIWLYKKDPLAPLAAGGEQPIDVAYTILALEKFYQAFGDEEYSEMMEIAFNWFLGNNHLHQIIYNPCTGGSYDGLEENYVNLNQGAESTVSYLLARLSIRTDSRGRFNFNRKRKSIEAPVIKPMKRGKEKSKVI